MLAESYDEEHGKRILIREDFRRQNAKLKLILL
jgi:hypothetical protein